MRRFITLLVALTAFLGASAEKSVYVLDINDEIGSTTWRHTRVALDRSLAAGADLFVLHLNTYGGAVDAADSIRTALLHHPMPVVAYIDNNAASAGALIALACDSVFMRPDATMGAATVVNGTDGAAMPDKYQSYMRAMMRATAEQHGKVAGSDSVMRWRRDPLIAEAMVDPRVTVPGLIDSVKVLTFTPEEAIRWGYADGKASSLEEVLAQIGIDRYRIERFKPTWIDGLMGFFTNPAVQAVLIMIIVGGIYFELQSPGMGFPTVAAITAAALYFLPLYLTGIVSSWLVLLFLSGVVLLLLELFVIPGFGIAGIIGAVMIVGSIFIGLLENFSFSPGGGIDTGAIWESVLTFGAGTVLAILAIVYLTSRHGPRFIRNRSTLTHSQLAADGYIGVDTSIRTHIGREATAVTDLHPSGKISIDGHNFDAVAEHGFIPEGTRLRVTRHSNAQLYVEPA